ncbi:hypothetical protein SAMN05216215_103712 [Saccharopolyspora shandongensis]|uniref:Uncharacterized protein n=1 Tax=Saccharopolyspora shandongensis TaxID=418495 RepID=A0A1H3N8U0_9PSEU|nr:hypothetical protein SAMN05216215_103712 [Saccharopolyspora shandongensis]
MHCLCFRRHCAPSPVPRRGRSYWRCISVLPRSWVRLWGYAVARLPLTVSADALYLVPPIALIVSFVWLPEVPHPVLGEPRLNKPRAPAPESVQLRIFLLITGTYTPRAMLALSSTLVPVLSWRIRACPSSGTSLGTGRRRSRAPSTVKSSTNPPGPNGNCLGRRQRPSPQLLTIPPFGIGGISRFGFSGDGSAPSAGTLSPPPATARLVASASPSTADANPTRPATHGQPSKSRLRPSGPNPPPSRSAPMAAAPSPSSPCSPHPKPHALDSAPPRPTERSHSASLPHAAVNDDHCGHKRELSS